MEYEVLYKIEEIKRVKQAKQFYDELLIIEELQTNSVLNLMKAKKLVETIIDQKKISKEALYSKEIKSYKSAKTERVLEDFKRNNNNLIEDVDDVSYYLPKKKKSEKTIKKATHQITYELWLEQNTVDEIAHQRKLTVGTILSHFTKLIQDKTMNINDVLPEDKIQLLSKAFDNYKEESLNKMKEILGDDFTWEEIRMFKASLT